MNTPDTIAYFRRNPEVLTALQSGAPKAALGAIGSGPVPTRLLRSQELKDLERCLGQFNAFSALGVTDAEIRHSRVLAWLLCPEGSHSQKAIYLHRFLETCLQRNGESLSDIGADLSDSRISTEDQNIDILIVNERSQFVCAIENKIHAGQGLGQLERYRKVLERLYPDFERRYIFLTLANEPADDPDWISVPFADVLSGTLGKPDTISSVSMSSILTRDYVDWIKSDGKPAAPLNLFNVLGFCRHELRHSDFLGWLLDPSGSHGHGDGFLKFFIHQLVRSGNPSLPQNAHDLDWSGTEIRREFENIDLLLINHTHNTVIVVENKLLAKERHDQLGDYRRFIAQYFNKEHLTTVFLDLNCRQSSDPAAVHISYRQLLGFFNPSSITDSTPPSAIARAIANEYLLLLSRKLWTTKGTKQIPPPELSRLVDIIWRKFPGEAATLVNAVGDWQLRLCKDLGVFLHQEACRLFNPAIAPVYKIWYSFVPTEFDSIPELVNSSMDVALGNRLLFYQFFVIPFGDQRTVRPPQLAIDVKMCKASRDAAGLKQFIHERALEIRGLFNRVKGNTAAAKFDQLLNFEMCSLREIASLSESELRNALIARLHWFRATKHRQIVEFFQLSVAAYSRSSN